MNEKPYTTPNRRKGDAIILQAYNHIRENLGDIPDSAMQGQTFKAQQAVELGFANDVMKSLDEMKAFLA